MPNVRELDSVQASVGDTTLFLDTLFRASPHHLFLEIRTVPPHLLRRKERFFRLRQLQRTGFDQVLPFHLDGQSNIYFGVVPRIESGHGGDSNTAHFDRIWSDYDISDQPAAWPLEPSVEWASSPETNPEKSQAVWLLTRPVSRSECVSLNRRMALVVGSDPSAVNPERILRLPGFINMKYPERPRARIINISGRRYDPEELDAILPTEPASNTHESTPSGEFDPHAGGDDIPQAMKDELTGALLKLGGRRHYDGRLYLPCPFPHTEGPCNCPQAFYFSSHSARWWCFCIDHPRRDPGRVCISGGAWSLWGVVFPGRGAPDREMSTSPYLRQRGGDPGVSKGAFYTAPPAWPVKLLEYGPRHKRTADLLRSVGQLKKADDEEKCGVPIRGKCQKHGFVRDSRATGKTRWCGGCHTETSARYTRLAFPDGSYTILLLRRDLGPLEYDVAEIRHGEWELDPKDSDRICDLVEADFVASTMHFRRLQRRYSDELLAWSYAVLQEGERGLASEFRVLVRHTDRLRQALQEITGLTRKRPMWAPDSAVRYDYKDDDKEQLRRDWAALLKIALLHLDVDALFVPIWRALDQELLTQPYGALRQAYSVKKEDERNGQADDLKLCPHIEPESGKACGEHLTWILDPQDQYQINQHAPGRPEWRDPPHEH